MFCKVQSCSIPPCVAVVLCGSRRGREVHPFAYCGTYVLVTCRFSTRNAARFPHTKKYDSAAIWKQMVYGVTKISATERDTDGVRRRD